MNPVKKNRACFLFFIITFFFISNKVCFSSSDIKDTSNDLFEIVIVKPISDIRILPDTYPLSGLKSKEINLSATRGEYTPVSFVIRALADDINDLNVITTDLVSNNNKIIDKSNLDVKLVKAWFQAGGAWESRNLYRNKDIKLVPELLLKNDDLVKIDEVKKCNYLYVQKISVDNADYIDICEKKKLKKTVLASIDDIYVKDSEVLNDFRVEAHRNKQVWLTIKIPDNASSTLYKGEVIITRKGEALASVALNVSVPEFDLKAPNIEYSLYYRGKYKPERPTISSEYKNKKQLEEEFLNMKKHGVSNPSVYQSFKNEKLLDEYLKIRSNAGFKSNKLYYLGMTTNPDRYKTIDNLKRNIETLFNVSNNYELNEVYIYGIDEAKSWKLLSQKESWAAVHDVGAKVFVAGYKGTANKVGDLLDVLVLAGKPDKKEMSTMHRHGNKIFNYNNPQTGPENPLLFRKNYGLELWRANYDGVMVYAYQHSMGGAWNDFDHFKFRDHNFVYPTVDGVVDTLAWEGFREGVDDVRYLSTLEGLLTGFKSEDKTHYDARLRAKKYLGDVRRNGAEDLDLMRLKLMQHIVTLSERDYE